MQFGKYTERRRGREYDTVISATEKRPGADSGIGFAKVSPPVSQTRDMANEYPGPKQDPNGQYRLFTHTYHPPVLNEIAVERGMEHAVPRLIGLAAQHSLTKWGRLPEADSDLSSTSLPMVKHLADRGLVAHPDPNGDRNEHSKDSPKTQSWLLNNWGAANGRDNVPAEDVHRASTMVRGMLRQPKVGQAAGGLAQKSSRQLEFSYGNGGV